MRYDVIKLRIHNIHFWFQRDPPDIMQFMIDAEISDEDKLKFSDLDKHAKELSNKKLTTEVSPFKVFMSLVIVFQCGTFPLI